MSQEYLGGVSTEYLGSEHGVPRRRARSALDTEYFYDEHLGFEHGVPWFVEQGVLWL